MMRASDSEIAFEGAINGMGGNTTVAAPLRARE
jgi:hypothetical protein